jgi:hypothetical protein
MELLLGTAEKRDPGIDEIGRIKWDRRPAWNSHHRHHDLDTWGPEPQTLCMIQGDLGVKIDIIRPMEINTCSWESYN